MVEEILRIKLGLHLHKLVEIILEILMPPAARFNEARIAILVHPQIQISVIHIRRSRHHRNIRSHVVVKLPHPIHMTVNALLAVLPVGQILNHERRLPVRERNRRFRYPRHFSSQWIPDRQWTVFLEESFPYSFKTCFWNWVLDEIGFGFEVVLEQRLSVEESFRRGSGGESGDVED
ncbi:hypothetical protein LINGRAHAP2_LOCUS26944 [Linum grandiflorum]